MVQVPEDPDTAPAVRNACIAKFAEWWSTDDMWRILADMDWQVYSQLEDHRDGVGGAEQVAEILLDMVGHRFLYSIDDSSDKRKYFLIAILSAIGDGGLKHVLGEVSRAYQRIGTVDDMLEAPVRRSWCVALARALGLPSAVGENYPSQSLPDIEVVEPHPPLNPLFDYQRSAGQYVRDMLEGRKIGGKEVKRKLIAVPTGAGKTRMLVETLVQWFNDGRPSRNGRQSGSRFVLWVAQSTELCEQAFSTFRDVFESAGRRGTTMHLYRFWGTGSSLPGLGMADLLEKGVVISTINSLYKILQSDWKQLKTLGEITSCIVIDEAHRSVSPMYSSVLEEMGFKWGRRKAEISSLGVLLIGLTATPFRGRGDNEETKMLLRRYNGVYYPDVHVDGTGGSFLPHAIIDCQPSATAGTPVWVLGEKSYDRDGAIAKWRWKVSRSSEGDAPEGKGSGDRPSWKSQSHREKNLVITFTESGRYRIALKVTDNEGEVGESSAEIVVEDPEEAREDDKQKELYGRLIQRRILCRVYHHVLGSPLHHRLDRKEMDHIKQFGEFRAKTVREIGYHKQRNGLILSEIERLHRGGRRSILFFGCSIEHSRLISALLKIMHGIESSYVDSRLDLRSRADAIEGFRKGEISVLCNYDVLTAGFDAPNVDCVFVGRPIRSTLLYTQMIGRGMRGTKSGGTEDVLLVDIDDNFQTMYDETVEVGWKIFREYWEVWRDGEEEPAPEEAAEPAETDEEEEPAPDPLLSSMKHVCMGCGVVVAGAPKIREVFGFECDDQMLLDMHRAGNVGIPSECRRCRDSSRQGAGSDAA